MDLLEKFKQLKADLKRVQSEIEDNIHNIESMIRKSEKNKYKSRLRKIKKQQ
jgi:hypothetical protein